MRHSTYLLLALLIFASSCRSIDKMVDRGQYDEAINYAARKLHGQKAPKTKHVAGLEEAYAKVMDRDLQEIAYLKQRGGAEDWDRVYDIYHKIARRQDQISAFLPLVSKDGFEARFDMVSTSTERVEAADRASALYYGRATDLLAQEDKVSARRAIGLLDEIGRYHATYRDSEQLYKQALYQGTTRVAVSVSNTSTDYLPTQVDRQLRSLDLLSLRSPWVEYYYASLDRSDTDISAVLEIDRVWVSPGTIDRHTWTETREIEVGSDYLRRKGQLVLDSLGQKIKVPRFSTVTADVTSTRLLREASIQARLAYYDYRGGGLVSSVPVQAVAVFDQSGSEYNGDKRALSSETIGALSAISRLRLPSAEDMIADAGEVMKSEMMAKIRYDVR